MSINSDIQDLMYRLLPRLLTLEITEDSRNKLLDLLEAVKVEIERSEQARQSGLEKERAREAAEFEDWEQRYRAAVAEKKAERAKQIARLDRLEQRVERIERRLGLATR